MRYTEEKSFLIANVDVNMSNIQGNVYYRVNEYLHQRMTLKTPEGRIEQMGWMGPVKHQQCPENHLGFRTGINSKS